MEESVIFEIQVEKNILTQVLNENQNLKENYENVIKNGTNSLTQENQKLRTEINNLKKTIAELNESTKSKNEDTSNKKKSDELINIRKQILRLEIENGQLDKNNLHLETQVENLSAKLRLEEERNKSNDLAEVECKLLKLKLHTIETEKKYLMEEFDKERKILNKQNKPRVAKLEENIKHLRKWIEKEARERYPKESNEVKFLKTQIQTLKNEKIDLIEGFELERKVFRKILKANKNSDLP